VCRGEAAPKEEEEEEEVAFVRWATSLCSSLWKEYYHDLLEMGDGKTVEERFVGVLEALEVEEAVDGQREATQVEERALELDLHALHDGGEQATQTQRIPFLGAKRRT